MTDLENDFGTRLATLRRSVGMSARELAEKAGTTRGIVANIETGRKTDVTIQELFAFSRALRVRPDVLAPELADPSNNEAAAKWEAHVARALRNARIEMGWSQQFAVERLSKVWGIEMHQTTLAKLENSSRPLTIAETYALAVIYGKTFNQIIDAASLITEE